jgi:uncharacterized protein (UPF0261 family)
VIYLPTQGVSAIDQQGAVFDDPTARQALFDAIRQNCGPVPVVELDQHINSADFAHAAAVHLIRMIRQHAHH